MARRLEPSDLKEAVCLGDVEEVMKLLGMSSTDLSESQENRLVRLNARNRYDKTALHLAVDRDHLWAVQTLISAGAGINVRGTSYSMSPLMYAVYLDRVSCVCELIKLGADMKCVDNEGRSALMLAAMRGRDKCLQYLIKAGADVNFQTKEFHSSEVYAGPTALMYAAEYKWLQCLRLLVRAGADVNLKTRDGLTALHLAARFSIESDTVSKCMSILLEYEADCNAETSGGETALLSMLSNYKTMFNLSNDLRSRPTYECAKMLIHFGSDVNKGNVNGETVLMQAVRDDNLVNFLPILVEAGVVIDQQDSSGMTALAHAASTGCHGSLRWLLHAGASVKICDNSGRSPLTHAAENGSYKCVRLLLSSRASLQICDHSGKTPLHYLMSSQKGNWDIQQCLRILISKHPSMDINSVDNQGRTALFLCLQAFLGAERRLTQDQKPRAHSLSGNYTKIKLLLQNDPTENIKLLLQNDAKLGTAILRVGELSRLTEIGFDMDLFQLGLGDEVDLKVQWDKFASVIEKERRRILQFLIINKVVPSLPAVRLRYRYNNTFDGALSMLEKALQFGHTGIAKYLIATCYLRSNDLTVSSARFLYHSVASNNPEVVTMVENLRTQPWPLVKLCFVAVSTAFGASPGRLERVKNSQLPTKLKNMLLFQEPSSRLCVHKWDNIPLTFSLEEYEKLPQPRPLLYHWPVGRKLVPCDCEKCDGTMYKYDKSGRKRKMTEDNMCAIND